MGISPHPFFKRVMHIHSFRIAYIWIKRIQLLSYFRYTNVLIVLTGRLLLFCREPSLYLEKPITAPLLIVADGF